MTKDSKGHNPNIPGMDLNENYSPSNDKNIAEKVPKQDPKKSQEKLKKTKKELEKLKKWFVKKYEFTQSISILPPQSIPLFIQEEEVPKETEKHIHLLVIIPEEEYKKSPEIKKELIKKLDGRDEKIWLHLKTPVDIWEICLDSKFNLLGSIAMSLPLYDKGFLGALRVAEIHKSLVLKKFDKYVVSYVIGGSLVRGEAVPTSDVDVFVIINDTDVKRMPRVELKERLRRMIYQYVGEASSLAGVKNKLEPQIYLLTDFWEGVKDAQPVYFTFIRDGIPLYDRGTFMPWKALLKMGRLKPSPEAIDRFMSMGDKTTKMAKRNLLKIVIKDLYWGVVTPSQALLMLNGSSPPSPKHLIKEMKKEFVKKEKMLKVSDIKILEKIVKIYKDYEHEKIKEIKGSKIDKLIKDTEEYLKNLKELREKIEKAYNKRTIEKIYKDIFKLLKGFMKNKSQKGILKEFEKEYVKKGKFTPQHLRILKSIIEARKQFKKGKSSSKKIDEARKGATILTNDLIDYTQRCELSEFDKTKMSIKYKDGEAQLINASNKTFLIQGKDVKEIDKKIKESSLDKLEKALEKQKEKEAVKINPEIFNLIEKEIGKFEIVL